MPIALRLRQRLPIRPFPLGGGNRVDGEALLSAQLRELGLDFRVRSRGREISSGLVRGAQRSWRPREVESRGKVGGDTTDVRVDASAFDDVQGERQTVVRINVMQSAGPQDRRDD